MKYQITIVMSSETIALIANLALTLSFIVGLIFGLVQVRVAARDRKERLTMETLREFQSREFAGLLQFINTHSMPVNRSEMEAMSAEDQTNFIQFGQEMESLGLLVAERLINLDLVDKTLGSFVVSSWEKYKPLFTHIRENTQDPYLGEYFQWLAERIQERMEKYPRKPFFEMAYRGK
jgi:hypothetical protein